MEQISNNNNIKLMNSNTHHCKSIYLLIKDKFFLFNSICCKGTICTEHNCSYDNQMSNVFVIKYDKYQITIICVYKINVCTHSYLVMLC